MVLLIETMDPRDASGISLKLEAFGISSSTDKVLGAGGERFPGCRVYVPEDKLELAREVIQPGMVDAPEEDKEKEEK
jgi:hypothetical protein